MNHIVLYQPQIPPNTGNIARTCAGTNTHLHLILPVGFSMEDKMLKRAGLDYWNELTITSHDSLGDFLTYAEGGKFHLISKFAHNNYAEVDYSDDSKNHYFIFGNETSGLPREFMREHREECVRIPMDDTHIRALNLSNAASIIIYEALRQQKFKNLDLIHHYDKDKLDEPK